MSTILIGVDSSERSEDAIAFAGRLAAASGAQVIVACAFPDTSDHHYAELRDAALDTAYAMSRRLVGVDPRLISIRSPAGAPADALRALAHSEGAELIVVGSTHTGRLSRVLPGGTAEKLLSGAPCAVAVVPRGYRAETVPVRIGVAYDGSTEARSALSAAVALAPAFGAELELIGVATGVVSPEDGVLHGGLEAAITTVPGEIRAHSTLEAGDPAEEIARRSADLDLLVTGSRGYGPLRAVLAGGVSGRLLRAASCPVLVVPRGVAS
jgi:nucleotide-binding universal stress UspA family protein